MSVSVCVSELFETQLVASHVGPKKMTGQDAAASAITWLIISFEQSHLELSRALFLLVGSRGCRLHVVGNDIALDGNQSKS